MPLSAELLATFKDAILTMKKIPLGGHIVSTRNGWMTLTPDGLTSKKKKVCACDKDEVYKMSALLCVQ